MSWGQAMIRALGAALVRPSWWVVSLAGFLVRGGLLLVVLPMVAVPTVAAISIFAAPLVGDAVLGATPTSAVVAITIVLAVVAAIVIATQLIGAWVDVALLDDLVEDGGLPVSRRTRRRSLRGALSARLSPHGLTALALAFAAVRIVGATYDELLSPSDPALPLVFRVISTVPEAVLVLVLAWALAEAIGGLAIRTFVSRSDVEATVTSSIGTGFRAVLRPSGLATLVVTNLAVAVLLVPLWTVTSRAFDHLRSLLADGASAPDLGIALVLLIVGWAAGLALLGVGLAWRATAWTAESVRRDAVELVAPAAIPEA